MKYLICSDIHGSASACQKVIQYFRDMHCDYLIILGDILYHGPRNPLPEGHNPKLVAQMLNERADKIIACRGNCDAEVDQMVLHFPILSDYNLVVDEGIRIFCTHGHIYAPERSDDSIAVEGSSVPPLWSSTPALHGTSLPVLYDNSIVLYGHTHIQVLEKNKAGSIVCNPGSVSLPKGESPAGFALYENGQISLFNINGEILAKSESLRKQ